tara:strand:+ start:79 stop:267 length:189 start_codon:yes stop_codon:yes gene_type:complete
VLLVLGALVRKDQQAIKVPKVLKDHRARRVLPDSRVPLVSRDPRGFEGPLAHRANPLQRLNF